MYFLNENMLDFFGKIFEINLEISDFSVANFRLFKMSYIFTFILGKIFERFLLQSFDFYK